MEATGVLAVGETTAAMVYIKGRWGLSPRQRVLIVLACILAFGIPLGAWASGSWLAAALATEFAVVGLLVGGVIVGRLAVPLMRKALAKRGQASELTLTFRLTPEALVYDLGELTTVARWTCVTDIYRTRKYWVFLVQTNAMVLPRRFFPTAGAERDFLANAMSRMNEAARARSPDAVRVLMDRSKAAE